MEGGCPYCEMKGFGSVNLTWIAFHVAYENKYRRKGGYTEMVVGASVCNIMMYEPLR